MEQNMQKDIQFKLKKRSIKRFWAKLVSIMMCTVVFCTTYVLILPAITEETDTFCGLEAHIHTSDCYPQQGDLICEFAETELHIHTDECQPTTDMIPVCAMEEVEGHTHTDACVPLEEKLLSCTLEEVESHAHGDTCELLEEKLLSCTLEATEGHAHTDACQPTEETVTTCTVAETAGHAHGIDCAPYALVCELSEDESHAHGMDCYALAQPSCAQEGTEGHVHDSSCYSQPVVYLCGLEEVQAHAHDDTCRVVTVHYGCGLEETAAHFHEDACYTVTTAYSCGLEETEGHFHGDACYITVYSCGLEEVEGHAHNDACYTTVYQCGLEETDHVHAEECYTPSPALICQLEEDDTHTHGVDCYNCPPICQLEVHEHELECYSNPNADLETYINWESTLPAERTGIYADDLLAIARSQLGYVESTKNYIVDESGAAKGYTRYGAWYGAPYGDWCAMFVSFCLHYAQVENMPLAEQCAAWVTNLQTAGMYASATDYTPKAGDILFFDQNGDAAADHVGIVANYFHGDEHEAPRIQAIEGNCNDTVCYTTYNQADPSILGYGILPESSTVTEESPLAEEPSLPEESIGPRDTNAWAVLVPSNVPAEEAPVVADLFAEELVAETSAYALRRTDVALMAAPRAASLPLTPYINSVVMYDDKGNVIPSGSMVTEGDLIEFRIEYTVTGQQLGVMNGETVTVKTDTLFYDLPKTFKIVKNDSGSILNSAGQVVGSYLIDSETGSITMEFTDDYVEQNAKGIQIHGYISFFSTVVKITDEDRENQNFQFTDNIKLGIVVEENIEAVGDLTIEKKKVSVNGEELVYELTVRSGEGTNGSITITDQMSEGLTFVEGISVKKGNTNVNAQFRAAADKQSFTLTLPEMAAGETYTVRYRCKADIDLLGTDMTVRNTATVTGKDSQDNELKDRVTVDHNFDVLKKTGELNEDGSISWTITVNHAKVDISGWTLQDIMRIQNQQIPYTGPVTIRDSRGNIVANNVKLPYTFPTGSTDTYTVTYTTDHDFGDGQTIYNSAILKDNDTEVNDLAGVVVGSPFTKTGVAGEVRQDENGNYLLPVTWTVTIDTTKAPISGGLNFIDEFRGYPADDMYMTYDQLMGALESFEAALLPITGQDAAWFTAWVYQPGPDSSNEAYDLPDLWNNVNNCQSKKFDRFSVLLGDKGIPKDHVLTFSYEAYGLFPNNIVSTTTYKNRFNLMGQYEVEGRVDHVADTLKATKYGIKYYDPEKHADQYWFWSEIDWGGDGSTTQLEYNQLRDSYLAWAIELSAPPTNAGQDSIVIYEDLPDGVSLKDVKLVFQNSVPINQLRLLEDGEEIELGKTYKWEFPLYTAEQYVNWNHRDGTPVSIDVKVTESGDLEISIPGNVLEVMSKYAVLQGLDESYGYLTIVTQINDDFDWTPAAEGSVVYVNTFENRYSVKTENGVEIDVGSQSQRITKDEREGVIRKKATTDNNNIATYSVVLNAYGRDLIENSDVLKIHDELTYTSPDGAPLRLRLVPGSVKLYEIDLASDGSYKKLGEVAVNYSYGESSSEKNGSTTWTHTIDLTIPDNKALLLEYSYKANGVSNIQHEVFNTCTITGVGEGEIEGDVKLDLEVKQGSAQADIKGVMLYKVDANSDGIFLENARFNIYIWNQDEGQYIIVHHPESGKTEFTTNAAGMIVLDDSTMDQFAYNTAYYIVEVESPEGYYLSPEPYYFQIVNSNTALYPSCLPNDFNGAKLSSGDIIYRKNVTEFTELTVEKFWLDYSGKAITVTGEEVNSVSLELWQEIKGDSNSATLYGTYTMTPDENGNWSLTIDKLPKATKDEDGVRGTDYLYYIKEVKVNGYSLESTENNDGIQTGVIKLVNRKEEGYVLPETGGSGTPIYTMAGSLMTLTGAAYLVYSKHFRRREEE